MRGDARVKHGLCLSNGFGLLATAQQSRCSPLSAKCDVFLIVRPELALSVRRQSSLRWVAPNVPSFVGGAASAQYGTELGKLWV